MVVEVNPTEWTKLNSNANSFIIQNLSFYSLVLIASDIQPLPTDDYELIIQPQKGINDKIVKKIFWGRALGSEVIRVGVVE